MDLGGKIKGARLEAGLSQRQLCAGQLTRNMLSQIENGAARPSMKTLAYLAERLGKPISFFLEEQTASPDQKAVIAARAALGLEDWQSLRQALDSFQEPEGIFREERLLLEFLCSLGLGEQALRQGRKPYALKLLHSARDLKGLYITPQLRRRNQVLLALAGESVSVACDEDMLLAMAMQAPSPQRQLEILSAADNKGAPGWNLLQGEALFRLERYAEAAICFRRADPSPQVYARLEVCFRELGDFRQAYEYACLQR